MKTAQELAAEMHKFGIITFNRWAIDGAAMLIQQAEQIEALKAATSRQEAKLAQQEQPAQEPVMYQYRWTNPGDNKDVSKSDLDWNTVEVRHPADKIESRIEELESSRYNGKPCYEVRGLFARPAPTQKALSDDEILNCFYASKSEGMAAYMLAVGRAIEAHCRGGAK